MYTPMRVILGSSMVIAVLAGCGSSKTNSPADASPDGGDGGVTPGGALMGVVGFGGDENYEDDITIFGDRGVAVAATADGALVVAGAFTQQVTFGEGTPEEITLFAAAGPEDVDMFLAEFDADLNLVWAKRAGGNEDCGQYATCMDAAGALAVLSDGTIIVGGVFEQDAVFGEEEPNETTLHSDTTRSFLAAYGAGGDLLWAKPFEGSCGLAAWAQMPCGLAAGEAGTFLVTSGFSETVTLGEGEPNATTLTPTLGPYGSHTDLFLAKYDASGALVWAKKAGGQTDERVSDLAVDDSGASYWLGKFEFLSVQDTDVDSGVITFGEGEPNETSFYYQGETGYDDTTSGFLAKYGDDGSLAWATRIKNGCLGSYEGNRVAVSNDGSPVVSCFSTTTDMGSNPIDAVLDPGGPNELHVMGPYFLAKYDANGEPLWARTSNALANSIVASADGSFVLTGAFRIETTWGSGEPNETTLTPTPCNFDMCNDVFVAKLGPEGALNWVVQEGGSGTASGGDGDRGNDVAVLADGSIVVIGEFSGTATFGLGEPDETALTANGLYDIFVTRLAP